MTTELNFIVPLQNFRQKYEYIHLKRNEIGLCKIAKGGKCAS